MRNDIGLGDRLFDCAENVGEHRTDDKIDLVAVEQGFDLSHGEVGLELVVGDNKVGLAAAQLAAELLERQRKPIAQLLAQHGGGPRQGGDQADFQVVLGLRARRPATSERGRDRNTQF